ncbi:MAG: hypothetical protein Q9M13_03260 [Mariprofundales bacterium]|nr:hypothetical protein [Mariprofundales bacterium]
MRLSTLPELPWIVLAIALLSLMGWLVDHAALAAWLPGIAAMTFNTALCFLLLALSLLMVARERYRVMVQLLALSVALFAALSLTEDLFGVALGIDNLLFDASEWGGVHPGRMSPSTSVCFLLAAVVVVALSAWSYWCRYVTALHGLLLLLLSIAVVGVAANLLLSEPPTVYAHLASMSLFTAGSFLLLALASIGLLHARSAMRLESMWMHSLVRLMYRLSYPQKFALISAIFLLPMTLLLCHEIKEASSQVAAAKLKLLGHDHERMTYALFVAFAEHRGMSNARKSGHEIFSLPLRHKRE